MIAPSVLFISNKCDYAIDYLISKFLELNPNIPYLRINSDDINSFNLSYDLNKIRIKLLDECYNLDNVKSVYFRRAPYYFPPAIDTENTPYLNQERKHLLEGLYLTLNAKWINPLFSTYIAERKVYQLKVAKEIGFNVPTTLISNEPVELEIFTRQFTSICKPISNGLQITSSSSYSIYTSKFDSSDLDITYNETLECPLYLQNKIENNSDVRVTIIGKKFFAVKIIKEDNSVIDWRKNNKAVKYTLFELNSEMKELILSFHKKLNLYYSAIDFIEQSDGSLIFLECNPVGEWVWLEKELNIPISEAIIFTLLEEESWQEKYLLKPIPSFFFSYIFSNKIIKDLNCIWILILHSLKFHDTPLNPKNILPLIELKNNDDRKEVLYICKSMYEESKSRLDKIEEKGFKYLTFISFIATFFAYFLSKKAEISFADKIHFIPLVFSFLPLFRVQMIKTIKSVWIPDIFDFSLNNQIKSIEDLSHSYLSASIYNTNSGDNCCDLINAARIYMNLSLLCFLVYVLFFSK